MTIPQTPREGGEVTPRGEHFSNTQPEPGTTFHAYIAGPTMWFLCHQPKRTKPCLAQMTNRELECPWCGTDKPPVRRGYVPIYRATDNAPRCVIVSDLYEDTLSKFKLHDRVTFGKESEQGDPVWVIKALTQTPAFQTTLRCRWNPVDLTQSLLKLWSYPELRKWYEKKFPRKPGVVDNAPSLPTGTAVTSTGAAYSPMMQAAAKSNGAEVVPTDEVDAAAERDRQMLEALQARQGATANGRHKTNTRPKG